MNQEKEFFATVLGLAQPQTPKDRNPRKAEREAALQALEEARIQEACDCGTCLTYTLDYPGPADTQNLTSTTLSIGTQDGAALILAQLEQGRLTSLEVAPTGDTPVTALPAPATLRS